MILFHSIRDIPADLNRKKNYFIEYNFLNQTIRYKLNMSQFFEINSELAISVNKMKIFYFFTENRRTANEFLDNQKVFNLKKKKN